jgi:anti-anti-sigma factor
VEGRILAANEHGAYALKLVGDVRVNLCTSIDDYLDHMFEDPALESVLVDLSEADGIDSTTLGLLAKLAIRFQKQFGYKPVIYSSDAGINRLLDSMAFRKIFDIQPYPAVETECTKEIPAGSDDAELARDKVIEAHRTLMGISADNRRRFKDLVAVLERTG